MYKIYVASLDGNRIYKESENKAELVEVYNNFSKEHVVFIVDLQDENGKQLRDELDLSKVNNKLDFLY